MFDLTDFPVIPVAVGIGVAGVLFAILT